ncbi:MAG: aminopeptidase P family protein [Alphaproteobacteria bacterium]|nr:MAG: aminopeptidase P family protein [Alphaproteobacteria bacterium]
MAFSKRDFLKLAGAGAAGAAFAAAGSLPARAVAENPLSDITAGVAPISRDERLARIARAQKLMAEKGIDAILVEPGSAMLYFTGIRWWRSERLTTVVIPREGEIGVVTPFFEEPSVRESMTFGSDVRTWNEHESPFERVAGILKDRGLAGGKIGLESTVRYFVVEGLKKAAPGFEIVSADPITLGCRMYKSKAELALMHKASEVTMQAYAHVWGSLEAGMTSGDIGALMAKAQTALGGDNVWTLILIGEASAYPHGSGQPQVLKDGDIVLMDCGCQVHGYQSDISRTFVFGDPTKRQREVWDTVRKGQQIAFETAQLGTPAGQVDDAVRRYYESLGYGPGYKTPGLSHRTGHGIGMDGHESVNFVHGETTPLAPGMCFSNEPGLYIFGEFGVRLEDCIHMTETGPVWFSVPPDSLDDPVGRMGPAI